MRIIVATRLSQLHDGSTGLDTQERETVTHAEAQGHAVVEVVKDSKSGAKPIMSRTKLRPWLTDPRLLASYDGIMVYRFDRLSRGDSAETRSIEQWADDHHKTLMTVDGLRFPCEGADGIRWDLAKRLAHDEYLRIKERYGRMQADVQARGGYIGKVPTGMHLVLNAMGAKELHPDPDTIWIIETALGMVPKHRLAAVSLYLSEQTGKPFHERNAQRLLQSAAYSFLPGWALAQSVFATRAVTGRGAREHKALLAALKCGSPSCDATGLPKPSPMYRVQSRGLWYYRCSGRGPRRKGCTNLVPLEAVDRLVLGGTEVWNTEPYTQHVWVAPTGSTKAIQALKAKLPYATDRKELNALYDQIEALETAAEVEPGYVETDTGLTVGQYLQGASLEEQRDYLTRQDIRAWHDDIYTYVRLNGALGRTGGPSAVASL